MSKYNIKDITNEIYKFLQTVGEIYNDDFVNQFIKLKEYDLTDEEIEFIKNGLKNKFGSFLEQRSTSSSSIRNKNKYLKDIREDRRVEYIKKSFENSINKTTEQNLQQPFDPDKEFNMLEFNAENAKLINTIDNGIYEITNFKWNSESDIYCKVDIEDKTASIFIKTNQIFLLYDDNNYLALAIKIPNGDGFKYHCVVYIVRGKITSRDEYAFSGSTMTIDNETYDWETFTTLVLKGYQIIDSKIQFNQNGNTITGKVDVINKDKQNNNQVQNDNNQEEIQNNDKQTTTEPEHRIEPTPDPIQQPQEPQESTSEEDSISEPDISTSSEIQYSQFTSQQSTQNTFNSSNSNRDIQNNNNNNSNNDGIRVIIPNKNNITPLNVGNDFFPITISTNGNNTQPRNVATRRSSFVNSSILSQRRSSFRDQNISSEEELRISNYNIRFVDTVKYTRQYEINDNIIFYDNNNIEIKGNTGMVEENVIKLNLDEIKKRYTTLILKQVNSRLIHSINYREQETYGINTYYNADRVPYKNFDYTSIKDYIYLNQNIINTVKIYNNDGDVYIISDYKVFNIGLKDRQNINKITFNYFMSISELVDTFDDFGIFIMFILQNPDLIKFKNDCIQKRNNEYLIDYNQLIEGFTRDDLLDINLSYKKSEGCNLITKKNNEYYNDKYLVLYYYYIYCLKLTNNSKYKTFEFNNEVRCYKDEYRLDLEITLPYVFKIKDAKLIFNYRDDDDIKSFTVLNSAKYLIDRHGLNLNNVLEYYKWFYYNNKQRFPNDSQDKEPIHVIDPIIIYNYLLTNYTYYTDYNYQKIIMAKQGIVIEFIKEMKTDLKDIQNNSQNKSQQNSQLKIERNIKKISIIEDKNKMDMDIVNTKSKKDLIKEYQENKQKLIRKENLTKLINELFGINNRNIQNNALVQLIAQNGVNILNLIGNTLHLNEGSPIANQLSLLLDSRNEQYNEERIKVLLALLIYELSKKDK